MALRKPDNEKMEISDKKQSLQQRKLEKVQFLNDDILGEMWLKNRDFAKERSEYLAKCGQKCEISPKFFAENLFISLDISTFAASNPQK